MKELELKLTWENGVSFTLTSREDAALPIIIVSVEENGSLPTLWPHIAKIGESYLSERLKLIGTEMRAP